MKIIAFFILIFGVVVIVGGVSGYYRGPSPISMWVGGLIGLFLILSSFFLVKKKIGWAWTDLVILIFLDAFFIYQWVKLGQLYPYALMSGLSLLVTILLIGSLSKELKKVG